LVATMPVSEWQGDNGAVTADIRDGGKKFTIVLKAENGPAFGAYITQNLDRLYQAFQDERKLEAEDRTQKKQAPTVAVVEAVLIVTRRV
jgi:RepB plasmid partitioning protein